MKKLQAQLKRAQFCGFTSLMQVRVFLAVGEVSGETTAREIADATGIVATQVSTVLRSLSDWGLVDLHKRLVMDDQGRNMPRIFATMTNSGRTSLDMLQMEVAL